MNKFVKIALNVTLILVVILGISFVELGTELVTDYSNYLIEREVQNKFISYSYITTAIAIISMSAIIFTILIGMMQYISTELSYQTYENRILKNKTSKRIFHFFIFLGVILIACYLFFDFTVAPITYSSILLMSILIVASLITHLYNTLFIDFSIYSLVDKQYKELMSLYKLLRGNYEGMLASVQRLESNNSKAKLDFLFKAQQNSWNKRKEKLISQRTDYHKMLTDTIKEYSFIASNAYKKNDTDLYRYILSYITRIGIHRFEKFGNITKNNDLISMLGIVEQYDRFVEEKIVPFYTKFSSHNSSAELIKCSNDEFEKLIIEGEKLKYNNAEDYNLTFYIILDLYKDNVLAQIQVGYQESILDFRNTITSVVKKFDPKTSNVLFRRLSEYVIELTEPTIKNLPIVNYIHLTEIMKELIIQALSNYDEATLENLLEKQITLLEINMKNIQKVTPPFTLQSLNKSWLDTTNQGALSSQLFRLFSTKYYDRIDDVEYSREMYQILETTLGVLEDKRTILIIACSDDHMFLLSLVDLIYKLTRIIEIYIQNDISAFVELYEKYLRLYALIAGSLKVEKPFDFHMIYDSIKNVLAETLDNDELFKYSYKGFINVSINAFRNIKGYQYASRCFDDLIWISTFEGKSELLEDVIAILDRNLDSHELRIYINDYKRQRRRFSHGGSRLEKFDSLIKYDEDYFEMIKNRLNTLLNAKTETVAVVETIVENEAEAIVADESEEVTIAIVADIKDEDSNSDY